MRTIKVIFIIIALSVFAINALYAQGTTCDTINMPVTPGWSGITYDANGSISMGNIVAKTDAGYYKYKNDKINAVAML